MVDRHLTSRAHEQDGEQRPLVASAQRDRSSLVIGHFEGTENPEFHAAHSSPSGRQFKPFARMPALWLG
ncbi:hypothetical protein Lesp02_43540 [Lentzea sp. NBRC 105346]|nr:hypothetical protein Lesp02_43540 [Lentzea sp. NBRC 105346]